MMMQSLNVLVEYVFCALRLVFNMSNWRNLYYEADSGVSCQQVKQQVSFFFSDAVEWDVVALDRVSDEHFQHQMYIKKNTHITTYYKWLIVEWDTNFSNLWESNSAGVCFGSQTWCDAGVEMVFRGPAAGGAVWGWCTVQYCTGMCLWRLLKSHIFLLQPHMACSYRPISTLADE